ncbi:potassium channel family protein [Burkholderia oklahomensis]|uniref:TrkA-N domain protein n=1 Tax=Burkholderia oklahomensis TaxID=342113 RepID=A0AAI8FRN4_9BURK|nr:potassium channel protein [Burkholderia oklahomensis]AIO70190.1 trkA-N domain protein [Burkholderia oklahomensis]AJX34153.1 trkA-N domain protein [Burkholderia oklahomensis C6786]AOI39452.1 potassium transporter TrkA [Burkholderia oklahomensis EO147]AOI49131.1 potassium transporter TrkA [Burkholderia oklahomensis C6786]KUY50365.1 potassium transporter TrkA [Burkholderia oklahomensis EO147]
MASPSDYRKSLRFRLRKARTPWTAPRPRTLFTRPAASPLRTLVFRLALVIGLCMLAFLVLYLDRDGLRDSTKSAPMSIADLVYFTMVTVATVGYGDIVPVTERARLIDAFFIVPIRIGIWFIFLGTAYQFVIQRVIEDFRMKRLQKNLRDHVVICGYGLSGSIAVRELLESGVDPATLIVIDSQEQALEAAAALGVTGLCGDPAQEDLLQQAQVRSAKAVIISVTDDPTAILLTLSVRSIAPDTKIVVRIQENLYQRQLRQAGADVIVSSTKIGALLLADAVESRYIVPFVNDMLSTRGRATLVERPAAAHEIGCMSNAVTGALVVGLDRAGKILSFYEDSPCRIEAGDTLVVIQSTRAMERAGIDAAD